MHWCVFGLDTCYYNDYYDIVDSTVVDSVVDTTIVDAVYPDNIFYEDNLFKWGLRRFILF